MIPSFRFFAAAIEVGGKGASSSFFCGNDSMHSIQKYLQNPESAH